jgi:hypothetical protein
MVGRIIDQQHPLWLLFAVLAAQRPQQKRQPGRWTTPRPPLAQPEQMR